MNEIQGLNQIEGGRRFARLRSRRSQSASPVVAFSSNALDELEEGTLEGAPQLIGEAARLL